MITQYKIVLQSTEDKVIPSFWAYRLYSWLLSCIPQVEGTRLHEQGEKPVSQYISYDKENSCSVWVVNLLTDEMNNLFGPVLREIKKISLGTRILQVESLSKEEIITPQDLITAVRQEEYSRRAELRFVTPTAFKQNGRYAIFPTPDLVIGSLLNKWELVCPEYPLWDEDAVCMLQQGVFVVDYNLRTTRYPLKNVHIPGFTGSVVFESRLTQPIQEIWKLLLHTAQYTGVGIKTTLGMGGTIYISKENSSYSGRNK